MRTKKHGAQLVSPGSLRLLFLVLGAVALFLGFVSTLFLIGLTFPAVEPLILPSLLSIACLGMLAYLFHSWRRGWIYGSVAGIYRRSSEPLQFWLGLSAGVLLALFLLAADIYLMVRPER
jgi:uncharacterized membrane protein